jgi:hypothetical protein
VARKRLGQPPSAGADDGGPPRVPSSGDEPGTRDATPFARRRSPGSRPVNRLFLLSPAHCGGERARLVMHERARFDLAQRLRTAPGVALGEVFSFLSGLYFRGKLAYAQAFARPPRGLPGVYVITPTDGMRLAEEPVTLDRLRRFAAVDIHAGDDRYRRPLLRDGLTLAKAIGSDCEVVLLGSVASSKYIDVLLPVFGEHLRFPVDFIGRGDMSRGGLLLRCARAGVELGYIPVSGAVRHGARPPRLEPLRPPPRGIK